MSLDPQILPVLDAAPPPTFGTRKLRQPPVAPLNESVSSTTVLSGYSIRPLRPEDAEAVYEVMAANEADWLGRVEIELADITADWQRPSFTVSEQTIGVFDENRLVGYAEVASGGRGDVAVHPEFQGQGIGTWLARWMQAKARERGESVVGQPVPEGSPSDRLLASLGYRARWTSWVLHLPEGAVVPERGLPNGYLIDQAQPHQYREAHRIQDAAFLEWSEREPEDFADFEAEVMQRPGFEPWNVRVVTDPSGNVAAMAIVLLTSEDTGREAYVMRLATRADQRNRGLAQSLLVDCFAVAREHSAVRAGLATDSRTGALDLYQKVGMVVTDTWVNRAIDV